MRMSNISLLKSSMAESLGYRLTTLSSDDMMMLAERSTFSISLRDMARMPLPLATVRDERENALLIISSTEMMGMSLYIRLHQLCRIVPCAASVQGMLQRREAP